MKSRKPIDLLSLHGILSLNVLRANSFAAISFLKISDKLAIKPRVRMRARIVRRERDETIIPFQRKRITRRRHVKHHVYCVFSGTTISRNSFDARKRVRIVTRE